MSPPCAAASEGLPPNERRFDGSKRYWLVGASEGLGRALAHEAVAAGAERDPERAQHRSALEALAAELPGQAARGACRRRRIADSVRAAAAEVGEIDGVVFLAGVYWPMRAQEWDADKVADDGATSTSPARRGSSARCCRRWSRAGAGHIVLTGSLSGFRGLPGAIGYGASKAGTHVAGRDRCTPTCAGHRRRRCRSPTPASSRPG